MVLGRAELAEVDSLGMEHIGQHGFPCVLQHRSSRWPERPVLSGLPAGLADQALEGGLRPSLFPQLPQRHVGLPLPPRSMGGSVAGGLRTGSDARGGVEGIGSGVGPRGVRVVLR